MVPVHPDLITSIQDEAHGEEEGHHNVFELVVGGLVVLTHQQGESHGDLGRLVDVM
jgi:hypothetical protein